LLTCVLVTPNCRWQFSKPDINGRTEEWLLKRCSKNRNTSITCAEEALIHISPNNGAIDTLANLKRTQDFGRGSKNFYIELFDFALSNLA
jgi:hypothetical protein